MQRRAFLAASAAVVSGGAGAFRAQAASTRFADLLSAFYETDLQHDPERASELGLDVGSRAALRSRLGDVSAAGLAEVRKTCQSKLTAFAAIDRQGLNPAERVVYDTVVYVTKAQAQVAAFDFTVFDGFSPSPYPISPITGAYQRLPVFLDTKHPVKTAEDADAYLERLTGYGTLLRANTERFRAAAASGATPPDFLLDTTLSQLAALDKAPREAGVVASLARRAAERGLSADYALKAEKIYEAHVAPALRRQIEVVSDARRTASHDPGVWRFANGAEFYAANLQYTTTTTLTAEEIHALGVEQAKSLTAKLETVLRSAGLTTGSVIDRVRSLYQRPEQLYPNTPAGKARLVADLQARLESMRAKLPRMFNNPPTMRIEVRPVPPEIDSGAPLAYSESPSLDGSRPGYVYFNLHDTAEWPKFDLPSTLYHESVPGHQLQGAVALQNTTIPLYVRDLYFSGYGEGWALYAEQLADELGEYDADPLGRIGLYKALIFRAGRCIVDTGMHHFKWSRERAIAELIALDGDAVGSTTREVDRYVAIPGQACSYKIGHTQWNRLRDRSRQALGAKFDIRAFHAAGLGSGALPLDILDAVIADWTASVKS